jgi:tRNA-splicing ligase RtcB
VIELREPGFRAPLKLWLPLDEVEPAALEQLRNAARHPEVAGRVAVMPDCHPGYGVAIGCVFPTAGSVLPNAVGVDIGCGMCAVSTGTRYDRERMDKRFWRAWAGDVVRGVPTGFSGHKKARDLGELDRPLKARKIQPLLKDKAAFQLGTLGGGNHFMEAQADEDGYLWLMVHSGSRHTGLRIAGYYNDLAMGTTRKRGVGAGDDLASLPLDHQSGQDYLADMAWATDFALENRKRMVERMVEALDRLAPTDDRDADRALFVNVHHNFARLEEVDGREAMVHRKGATSAYEGQLGIIPGSMGSPSYIVRGKGNEEGLRSCSHGAGRRMGRNAAKKAISEAAFAASLDGTYSEPSLRYVDEAPGAYKDIETVIARQSDLVEVVHALEPIITIKGDSRAKED